MISQNYAWRRYEEFASTVYEMYDGDTYRLYTENEELEFAGYILTIYHYRDTSYRHSATSSNIGYGSRFYFCSQSVSYSHQHTLRSPDDDM